MVLLLLFLSSNRQPGPHEKRLALGDWQKHRRVLDQQGCGAPKNLGVCDAEQASVVLIFRLVQGEQMIALGLKDRLIDGQSRSLAFVDATDIDSKGEIGPRRLHLAVREEE